MAKRKRTVFPAMAGMSLMMNVPMVMGLRLAKIGRGGRGAPAEASRMITEKVAAALEAQAVVTQSILRGTTGAQGRIARLYARKVAANRRRLSR